MASADARAGAAQQRRLILENAGDVEIPAYGAVEVTGVIRDELLLIYQVQAPTGNTCMVMFNGPCAIPVEKSGRPGTTDYPLRAKIDLAASSYMTGTEVGIEEGSFALRPGSGWIVWGDKDETNATVVIHRCWAGRTRGGCLVNDHPGRATVFQIRLGTWDPVAMAWEYGDATGQAIDHRYGVPYPSAGARGLFEPRTSTEHGTVWETIDLDCESPGPCIVEE